MAQKRARETSPDEALTVERVPVDSLHEDPANVRKHSGKNLAAIKASLTRFGQRKPIVVGPGGVVVAGNGTLRAFKALGWSHINITRTSLTGAEAVAFAIADNRTAELADWEDGLADALAALAEQDAELARATGFSDAEAEKLRSKLDAEEIDYSTRPEWTEDEDPVHELRDGRRYASSNEWGIPDLRPDMLGDVVPTQCHDRTDDCAAPSLFIYQDSGIAKARGHVVCFFEWDHRFESAWNKSVQFAERLVAARPAAVCAPDFSVWGDVPWALQIYQIYRRAWCCRLWQDAGLKVIPILSFSTLDTIPWALAGIPVGAPVVAFQARTSKHDPKWRDYVTTGVRAALEKLQPRRAIVYADESAKEWLTPNLPQGTEYTVVLPNTRTKRESHA